MSTTTPLDEFDGKLLPGLTFCSKVYDLFESIRSTSDGASRMRRRPTILEKRLLEELLPICKYVQASHRPGRYLSVRWVNGSQQYDAEILQRGAYVNQAQYPEQAFLEVTCAVHPKDHLIRELLDTKGGAFGLEGVRRLKCGDIESVPVAYRNRDFVNSYAKLVVTQLTKKTKIPYPENTTLIVQCTLNMPYVGDEWDELMFKVQGSIPPSGFREIYLFDDLSQRSHTIHPR